MNSSEINNEVGDLDLFLLDLILKGRVERNMKVLDAGCGSGRNLFYFLKQGFDATGIDENESEVKATNFLSRSLGRKDVCLQASLLDIPFDAESFDFIICSRVMHFAESQEEFWKMISELRRVLTPKGLLYLSLDSMIGMESKVHKMGQNKYQFPDGSVRFVFTENLLTVIEKEWNHAIDPRTVNFNAQHAETTLVLSKG